MVGPSTVVIVFDNTVKGAKNGNPLWFLRVDTRGNRVINPHLNVNKRITGLPDAHTSISNGILGASPKLASTVSVASKVAVVGAITIDTVRVGKSVYKDVQNGSTRNAVETVATVAGGWGGGYGGGMSGAAAGTVIFPGVGTIIGSIIGGVVGAIAASTVAEVVTGAIADATNYNMIEKKCKSCERNFKIRKYKGEKDRALCDDCYTELVIIEDPRGNVVFCPNTCNAEKIAEWEEVLWPRLIAYIFENRVGFEVHRFANDADIVITESERCFIERKEGEDDFYVSIGPQYWSHEDYASLNFGGNFVEARAWLCFSNGVIGKHDLLMQIDETNARTIAWPSLNRTPRSLFHDVFDPLNNVEMPTVRNDLECVGRVDGGSALLWHKGTKKQLRHVKTKLEKLTAKLNMNFLVEKI